jgi:hypothetical protein
MIEERTLRHFIFEWCLAKAHPPVIEELLAASARSNPLLVSVLVVVSVPLFLRGTFFVSS